MNSIVNSGAKAALSETILCLILLVEGEEKDFENMKTDHLLIL